MYGLFDTCKKNNYIRESIIIGEYLLNHFTDEDISEFLFNSSGNQKISDIHTQQFINDIAIDMSSLIDKEIEMLNKIINKGKQTNLTDLENYKDQLLALFNKLNNK